MLINTVLLFLRDVLPAFIVMSLLMTDRGSWRHSYLWLIIAVPTGILGALMLVNLVGMVSDRLNGAGMEVLIFSLHTCVYMLVLLYGYYFLTHKTTLLVRSILSCAILAPTIWISGANFLVFFTGYWFQTDAAQALILGSVLGLGINLSVAILLFFATNSLMEKYGPMVQMLMLIIFSAGKLSQATHLLVQIDWLDQTAPLWDSSDVIRDDSVTGHFLRSFIGYEAAPGMAQVVLYVICVALPFITMFLVKKKIADVAVEKAI